MITKLINFLQKRYYLVLALGLLLAIFSWPRMLQLLQHVSSDPIDLLPAGEPSVQTLKQIREHIPEKSRFAVILESADPEMTRRALEDLAQYLSQDKTLGRVELKKPGYEFWDKNKLLFASVEDLEKTREELRRKIQREKLGPLYIDLEDEGPREDFSYEKTKKKYADKYGEGLLDPYYVSSDGRSYGLFVESLAANLSLAQEKAFQDRVTERVRSFDLGTYRPPVLSYLSGATRVMEYRSLVGDLARVGGISAFLLGLPLLVRFRRLHYVILIFFPLAIGVPAGMSLAAIWVPRLNVTTAFLFAILGGLGVETGIHLFSRYEELRTRGASVSAAWEEVYESMFKPIATAVAALSLSFIVMWGAKFRGFSEFGVISFIGLWVMFLLYFTFFPALLISAEKWRWLRWRQARNEGGSERTFSFSPPWVKGIVLSLSALTLAGLIVLAGKKIQFEYNTQKIRADLPEQGLAKAKQRSVQGSRVNSPAAVLISSEQDAKKLKGAFNQVKATQPDSLLGSTRSIYDLVPTQQVEKLKIIAEMSALLNDDALKALKGEKRADLEKFKAELAKPQAFGFADLPEMARNAFLGPQPNGQSLFLIFARPEVELDDGRLAMSFAESIEQIHRAAPAYYPSSNAIVFAQVLSALFRDAGWILPASIVGIWFLLYLDLRRFRASLLVLASILVGLVWVFLLMYLFQIKLNLYNMVLIPALMGMSIDNSVHIYHRYQELGRGSLGQVWRSTGVSALLASLTNGTGFIALIFSSHGGLRSMGLIAVLGLGACLVSTLIFLPLVLQWREWRQANA